MEPHLRTNAAAVLNSSSTIAVDLPTQASAAEREGFIRVTENLAAVRFDEDTSLDHDEEFAAAGINDVHDNPYLAAAAHILIDLVDQGWVVHRSDGGVTVRPPDPDSDRGTEKLRVRRQEHLRRDAQLREPSVRRFVRGMEAPHEYNGRMVSVFNLMRDGEELAVALERGLETSAPIKPYVQVVDAEAVDAFTGFRLQDIWRYFRHTWSNAYQTVPGRSMALLIRDAATEHHTVIGLAALSSPIVQIAGRDNWIGWSTAQVLDQLANEPSDRAAQWVASRIRAQREDIYVADLLREDVLSPPDLVSPAAEAIARLREDADRHRAKHHRGRLIRDRSATSDDYWVNRAETPLFRSKRAKALADTLDAQRLLGATLGDVPTGADLSAALNDRELRKHVGRVVRRARGERVGTVIADLTVCGAVAPYNALAAGKLVGALAASPFIASAYARRYDRPSEIASAIAGRPIRRESRLSFIGTTSLYGSGASQYNRLFWPAEVMGGREGERLGYYPLGRSRSFGSSHFSDVTIAALVRVSEHAGSLVKVNSMFGEGVSPRLRKVRLGLNALGWSSEDLLKHGRERILFGVPLVRNVRDYSLGIDSEPDYLFDSRQTSTQQVVDWWFERWASRRAARPEILEQVRQHKVTFPIQHGARVPNPPAEELPER